MDIDQILTRLGITELNDMQLDAARLLSTTDDDITILSPTGSGKTLAYLLPVVFKMNDTLDALQVVVMLPSRELAKQSLEVFRSLGTGMRGMALYGGRMTMEEHREIVKQHPQIVFATPGRLNDHIAKGNLNVHGVRILVLDEFDKCLNMGFADEMQRVFASLPSVQRRILLSATDCDEIPAFVDMDYNQTIDYTEHEDGSNVSDRVEEYVVKSPSKDKLETLAQLLRSFGSASTIVFLNYRNSVERTYEYLTEQGFVASLYHGGLEQREREDNLNAFSNGSATVLVSTDIASRGLDIPDVDNVVHYHLPQGEAEYVHRVGRTARWEAEGRTFLLLGPEEHLPEFISDELPEYTIPADLPAVAKPRMATLYIGKGKKDKISKKDVLGFLCKVCRLQGSEIGKINVTERYCYVAVDSTKVKQVLRLSSGEKIKGVKTEIELKSPIRG